MKLTPRQREVIEKMNQGWSLTGSGVLFQIEYTDFIIPQGRTINALLDKKLIEYKTDIYRHYELTEKGKAL